MKDITHYFADLPRNSESATVPTKEVREDHANIEETAIVEEESKPKKKRGRVKIKISRKSKEGTVCDIVDSSTDLVDKTPSPFPQPKRQHIETNDDTPKKSLLQDSSSLSVRLNKKIKKSMDEEMKNQANGVETRTKACNDLPSAEQAAVDDKTNEEKTGEDSVKRKRGRPRKDYKEKLIELAEKKGYAKRKALEEQEAEKMERIFEKRKQYFTVQPKNNNAEVTQRDENSPKNSESDSVKRPGSLLNYFSKATPEHLEKERLMKAKLTVKAEVHTPTNSPIFVTPASDKKKKVSPKKKKSSAKQLDPEFDEIQLIQTETIVLSPKNEKLKSPMSQNKPRWSMKIQLQSNSESTSGMKDDEEIYTPTAPSKVPRENMKNNNKIPKVLLPIKNKKSDPSTISLDNHNKNSNEERSDKSEKKYSMIEKEEKSNKKEKKSSINDKEEKSRNGEKKNSINDNIAERSNKIERKKSINNKEEKSNKRERKNSINSEENNVKTDKQKTVINEKLNNCSTAKKCETQNESIEIVEVIEVIEDEAQVVEENPLKRKSKEKLAPLFTKRIKPSAEVIAARRLFLQSDINENTDSNAKKKTPSLGPKVLPFPKISHVNQLQPADTNGVLEQKFMLKNNGISQALFDFSLIKDKSVLDRSIPVSEHLFECVKTDIETVLAEIESYCSDVHSLWKYVSTFSKPENPKPVPKTRRRISEKKNLRKSCDALDELLYSPWTDKYKPNTTTEVVGNEEAAIKLKAWLDGWKAERNREDYSSGEEFYNSDCSLSSNIENHHVAILIGPHGSGKTASVYAVAHELGYKVLEVNASSKRPGKKILKDFEEATKSHRVKKSTLKDAFVTIPKKEETKKISQNSLILFEDVDLIFEEDEGFVSAAFQLASNTKRPIVMTLRDTCSYLPKLAPQQFRINFQPVSGKRVPALLQLIALAETGCKLSQNCVDVLCQSGDLRQGLLQLQYLLISGKERISSTSLAVNKSIWKEIKANLYKPAIKAEKSKKKKQTSDDKNLSDKALDNLVTNLDRFSTISTLIDIQDPTSELVDIKSEPSMSLSESMNSYSSLQNTSLEIGNWLKNAVIKSAINDSKKSNSQIDSSNHLLTKKQINRDVDLALSQIASNTTDRRALSVDYLSSIRTICRAEEIRNKLNSKRGNRFFHYLQNSRIASGAARSGNILSAACTMLHEKSSTAET
ncbi:hypothetical protein TSAR_008202 [Trichomalopsis sarcophagae]|uniref:ATPase AAA-type core domain-containing protein n=1 Tax=Trichomalopsis sarcophagae TaxID=543379 RepID=A0A232EFR8_9HYME|nr:hypothetical protein TSAR_008202 [Trichomalopsis sarcophagae]